MCRPSKGGTLTPLSAGLLHSIPSWRCWGEGSRRCTLIPVFAGGKYHVSRVIRLPSVHWHSSIFVTGKTELKARILQYLQEINTMPVVFRWKYQLDTVMPP